MKTGGIMGVNFKGLFTCCAITLAGCAPAEDAVDLETQGGQSAVTYTDILSLSGPSGVGPSSCNKYTVTVLNPDGTKATIGSSHPLTVTLSGISGTIYSDGACSAQNAITIGNGINPATFSVKAGTTPASGSINVTANLSTWQAASLSAHIIAPIARSFFGMHFLSPARLGDVPFGTTLVSGVTWYAIELNTTPRTYTFTNLDNFLDNMPAGVTVVYNILHVPQWDATDSTLACSGTTPGCSSPPKDLKADGTGTNAYYKNFVTALVQHLAARGKAGKTTIHTYQLWNEPNGPTTGFWGGTMAQMARMAGDLRQVLDTNDPGALLLTPGVAEPGYPCLGTNNTGAGCASVWLNTLLATSIPTATSTTSSKNVRDVVNVVAWHAYMPVYNNTAEPNPMEPSFIQQIGYLIGVVSKNYGSTTARPLWNTEGGWGENTQMTGQDEIAFFAKWFVIQASAGLNRALWYQYDNPNWGTLWTSTSGMNSVGKTYEDIVNYWIVGASPLAPCTQSGATYSCHFQRNGFDALIMWVESGTGTAQVAGYNSYRDTTGTVRAVSGGSVPLTIKPVIIYKTGY
jgi:hypothetical protein